MRVARMGCAASFGPQWHGAAMRRISVWAVGLLWLCDAGVRDGRRRRAPRGRQEPHHDRRHAAQPRDARADVRLGAPLRRHRLPRGAKRRPAPAPGSAREPDAAPAPRPGHFDVFATRAPATTDWPRRRPADVRLGYRRMCRFWFSGVFELADVRRLSYLMRLDTDSELRCRPGSRDPFELMARQRAVYGYVAVKTDHPMVAKNHDGLRRRLRAARAADPGRVLPLPAACSYKLPTRRCSTRTLKS